MTKFFFIGRLFSEGEVGGVISFTNSFSKTYISKMKLGYILDIYDSKKKVVPKNVNYIQFRGNKYIILLKLYIFVIMHPGVYFFNFSSIGSLLFFTLLPKFRGSKWLLVLHNGDQLSLFDKKSNLIKYIFKRIIHKFDRIGSISSRQDAFYTKLGLIENVYKVNPYIEIKGLLTPSSSGAPVFLISGYPTDIYRHEETINTLSRIRNQGLDIKLNICIYGNGNEEIRGHLIQFSKINKHWVCYYESLDASHFSNILKSSTCYLRMNSVDSYGLVCAEAVSNGLDVIATSVCERYEGVYLINVDDFVRLEYVLLAYLKGEPISKFLNASVSDRDYIDWTAFIKF